jgi:hypothetical protein
MSPLHAPIEVNEFPILLTLALAPERRRSFLPSFAQPGLESVVDHG